jgi:hypothetical protein
MRAMQQALQRALVDIRNVVNEKQLVRKTV